jgi:hypothetical protein
MARPPGVFVRPVTMTEGRRLQRIGRTARGAVKLRRPPGRQARSQE